MVLEAAINGAADALVSFNRQDFGPVPARSVRIGASRFTSSASDSAPDGAPKRDSLVADNLWCAARGNRTGRACVAEDDEGAGTGDDAAVVREVRVARHPEGGRSAGGVPDLLVEHRSQNRRAFCSHSPERGHPSLISSLSFVIVSSHTSAAASQPAAGTFVPQPAWVPR